MITGDTISELHREFREAKQRLVDIFLADAESMELQGYEARMIGMALSEAAEIYKEAS